ncbi:MAG: dTDP-4-dehydrorhamnose 3,5-epimerase family protein [Pyrinomonadaceae bacterium]
MMRDLSAKRQAEKPSDKVADFRHGAIHDVIVRDLQKFEDTRGWLAEIFRHDELNEEFYPQMTYISMTEPHTTRGPHAHTIQTDLFCFIGPSNFKLRLWDTRPESPTFGAMMTLFVGEDNPQTIIIPKRIVHGYQNIGDRAGLVINCPNRLFMGAGRSEKVDEIRYENDPAARFSMDD